MNEKKIRHLRFDKLKGTTPLNRLTAFLRLRNIRNLALLTVLMLVILVEIFILLYINRMYGNTDSLVSALVIFSFLILFYLPPWFWLIILVFRPDKSSDMRKLRRLGSMEKLAGKLEEDLAAESGVLFQKGSVLVTKRFIIEANLFYFRVYPLKGLREFDSRKARPTFSYENGTKIKMVMRVPLYMLNPYIKPEGEINMGTGKSESTVNIVTKKPKLRKRDIIIDFSVFLCITGVLLYLMCFKLSIWVTRTIAVNGCGVLLVLLAVTILSEIVKPESQVNMEIRKPKRDVIIGLAAFLCIAGALFYLLYFNKLPVWGIRAVAGCCLCVLLWLLTLAVNAALKDMRLTRTLLEIKDPGELIHKMEELYAMGQFNNKVLYLNQLSTVYYDKQDAEKALELVREAYSIQFGKREFRIGSGMTVLEMLRLNEITYLTALERLDEAEALLAPLDDKRYKSPVALYLFNANRAQLAIEKSDTKAAREYLHRVSGLTIKGYTEERRANISCHLLLLEAECDLIEQDMDSALAKLDDVLARSTWAPSVKRAAELRGIAHRKSSGLRRRRRGFRACQARRWASPKSVTAQRRARRRVALLWRNT